jgi:hypothetical protein
MLLLGVSVHSFFLGLLVVFKYSRPTFTCQKGSLSRALNKNCPPATGYQQNKN